MTRSQLTKRGAFVVATLGVLLGLTARASAWMYTQSAGGQGGGSFQDFCTTITGAHWLQGFSIHSGSYIDNIMGQCDDGANLADHGGGGGSEQTFQSCPAGWAVVGLVGRSGAYVDQLQTVCINLSDQNQTWDWPGTNGGNGGSPYSIACFENNNTFEAAIGLFGRSGVYVDQIGLICDLN